jgi:hypothetical protein
MLNNKANYPTSQALKVWLFCDKICGRIKRVATDGGIMILRVENLFAGKRLNKIIKMNKHKTLTFLR